MWFCYIKFCGCVYTDQHKGKKEIKKMQSANKQACKKHITRNEPYKCVVLGSKMIDISYNIAQLPDVFPKSE